MKFGNLIIVWGSIGSIISSADIVMKINWYYSFPEQTEYFVNVNLIIFRRPYKQVYYLKNFVNKYFSNIFF